MNQVINFLKKLPIRQILTVFLAGILLFVGTACNSSKVLAKTADQIREEVPETARTSVYKGGMNDYSDVDPAYDTKATDAKAKGLEDNAERNLKNRTGNPLEAVKRVAKDAPDPKEAGKNIKEKAEDIGDKASRAAQKFGEKTKVGSENLKENTKDFIKGAKDTASEATDKATNAVKSKVGSDIDTTKRNTEKAGDAVKSKVNSDVNTTKRALDEADD